MKNIILFIGISLLYSCKHDTLPPSIKTSDIPANICFSDQIQPMLAASCALSDCHGGNEEPNLVSYEDILHLVKPGKPEESKLYQYAIGSEMPPSPKTPMNLQQVTLLYGWILQGALNTQCVCDTNVFTYSATISPIIASNCYGCHNGGAASAGLSLTTYAEILGAITSRHLLERISNSSAPMPPSGIMSDCKIKQIQKWYLSGMPQN